MSSIFHIVEGWRNHLVPPANLKDLIKQVHEERMAICEQCPEFSENAKKNGYETWRKDKFCTKCLCPLKTKTKSLHSSCPLNKWEAVFSKQEVQDIEKKIKDVKS